MQPRVIARTDDLLARRAAVVPRGVFNVAPIFAEWAEGARLRDVDGREYVDFAGGLGVLAVGHRHPAVGHRHPAVVDAVRRQLDHYLHTCFHVAMYEPYVALAERLNALAPGRFTKKTMFTNSGVEAVENAVKIARAATGRTAALCFEHAFHGRTLLGLSLTCAAALAVLDVIEQEDLVARARQIGDTIIRRFHHWQERFSFIGDVRGIGAMCGMELVEDRTSKAPARALTTAILGASLERGLLILRSGVYDNVIRMLLPLITSDQDLDRGLGILEQALASAHS